MQPKTLKLIEHCIEIGIDRGFHKAYKHNDNPGQPLIKESISMAIMDEIYEWFEFQEEEF